MPFLRRVLALAAIVLSAAALFAQHAESAARADGQRTPLLVYEPVPAPGCAPLAVISHGAGGSENGYRYLAEAMVTLGYRAIVMGHRESGLAALRGDMRQHGVRPGIAALVTDPKAESARLLDVAAALAWAEAKCHAPFRVLLGHSMGAETVMLEAGAKNIINVAAPPAAQDRFDAYIALSPEGPGPVFPAHAWQGIRKPVLVMTGKRDQAVEGPPENRQVPWQDLPGVATHCQWMGVIDDATHMNFAGNGAGAERVTALVDFTIERFLNGIHDGRCDLPALQPQLRLRAK